MVKPPLPLSYTSKRHRPKSTSRPVSRVLYGPCGCPHGRGGHSSGTSVAGCLGATHPDNWPGNRPGRVAPAALSLFGLAPDGVCRAVAVAGARGGLFPRRFTLAAASRGGLFSVALSLGLRGCPLPRPEVIRHRCSMEPGLSSNARLSAIASAATRPAGRPHIGICRGNGQGRGVSVPGNAGGLRNLTCAVAKVILA